MKNSLMLVIRLDVKFCFGSCGPDKITKCSSPTVGNLHLWGYTHNGSVRGLQTITPELTHIADRNMLNGRLLFAIPKKGASLWIVAPAMGPFDNRYSQVVFTRDVLSSSLVCETPFDETMLCGLTHVARVPSQSGADIQFNRPNRLDVCLVQNHQIALYVSTSPHNPP